MIMRLVEVTTSENSDGFGDSGRALIVRFLTSVRGAAGAFHEAGVADAGAVFQSEVDAARWVDIGAAFSAAVFVVASIAVIV